MANIPAPGVLIDLGKLFQKYFFDKPYVIKEEAEKITEGTPYKINGANAEQLTTLNGSLIKEQVKGVDIWFPTRIYNAGDSEPVIPIAYLPYSVVRITGKKNIVKTPVLYRKGTVKEHYNTDDYSISIKGFLIGNNGRFPEAEVDNLKETYELNRSIRIDNAITNIFLTGTGIEKNEQQRIVIESLEFPEVEGGRINVKPFSMQLVSDFVFTLELK